MKIYDYKTKSYVMENEMKIDTQYRVVGNVQELSNCKVIRIMDENNTLVERIPAKYTVSAQCSKYESEDEYERTLTTSNYYRTLEFELTINSEDEATQDYIYSTISNSMQSALEKYDFQFSTCPTIEDGQYLESASVEYTHGQMAETKKAIMTAYKEAKKSLR